MNVTLRERGVRGQRFAALLENVTTQRASPAKIVHTDLS